MKLSFILFTLITTLIVSACQTMSQTSEQNSQAELTYLDYTEETYESLLGEKPFAIFFHAPWCPTCVLLEREILANSESFPEGSIILKADFDTEMILRKKYNIRSQSVVVMIDSSGEGAETLVAPSISMLKNSFLKLLQY